MSKNFGRAFAVLTTGLLTTVFLLTVFVAFNHEAFASQTGSVTVNSATLRTGPGASYSIKASLPKGTNLEILKEAYGWYNVGTVNKQTGWIAKWAVTTTKTTSVLHGELVAVINVPVAEISNSPSYESQGVIKGYYGQQLKVIGQQGSWYQVVTANGSEGWISDAVVRIKNPEQPKNSDSSQPTETSNPNLPNEEEKSLLISGGDWVNIRSGPGTTYAKIATLPEGTSLIGLQKEGDWYQVRLEDGSIGWIFATYVMELTATPPSSEPSQQPPASRGGDKPLSGRVIVVDPGHAKIQTGGWLDPGAVGLNGLLERQVTIDVALKLRDLLTGLGATVIMTHTGSTELTLQGRADVANNNNADIFVSIHANANTDRNYGGTSTYYNIDGLDQTQRDLRVKLAGSIQNQLVGILSLRDIGILQGPFTVIKATKMPSVLVETAFISNPAEEELLAQESFRLKIAQGIAAGIDNYFN